MLETQGKGGGQTSSKGSGMSPSGTGTNQGLAALFQNNAATQPARDPGQTMPLITAPPRPVIQPPAPHPLLQPPAAVDDTAARHLAMLQDQARQRMLTGGTGTAGRMINWNTNPQWIGTGGRNAR